MSGEEPFRFARNPSVLWDEVDGVMTLCHTETVEYYRLDEVGSLIWKIVDERATVDGIAKHLAEIYPDEAIEFLAKEVECFISSLEEAGLVGKQGPNEG